ncbi:MAG: hypothetical protein HZY75_03680 [Nocardioidaceae bacterium]|nr:MAG: hypothetical protein HZY75_03680 [Nocardioidaceae bacterium]
MTTTRIRAALVAAALVPALSACATNFGAPTEQDYIPAAGVSNRDGVVNVLNTVIVTGNDGAGTVVANLVNTSVTDADQLTSVTVDGQPAQIAPGANTVLPASSSLNLADPAIVFATGDNIVPGGYVNVTFTFTDAEAATVQAPVFAAEDDFADVTLPQPSVEQAG